MPSSGHRLRLGPALSGVGWVVVVAVFLVRRVDVSCDVFFGQFCFRACFRVGAESCLARSCPLRGGMGGSE